jgi:cation:H+ antiporter
MADPTQTQETTPTAAFHGQNWLQIGVAATLAAPGPIIHLIDLLGIADVHMDPVVESLIFGLAILAAATLLVWASEVAEQLVSATLALAILAIIAVLPEYAVDLYFSWTAGKEFADPALLAEVIAKGDTPAHELALANMTGANRLLIGFAWPVVFGLFWLTTRKRELFVGTPNSVGLIFLGVGTIYSFLIPIKGGLAFYDSFVLIGLFVAYLILSSRTPSSDHELMGPARSIAALSPGWRWTAVIGIFTYAAAVVFLSAEPFANGLVHTGESLGVDEFLLVQWVAPLASEAPEFILAAMLALRGRAAAGMTLLISSKVNQWTLLVGSLPLAYNISAGTLDALPVESRQAHEVFLTAGQSIFAVAVLVGLSFSAREAILIFVLFITQLAIPVDEIRVAFGFMYVALALLWFFLERKDVPVLWQHAVATAQGEGGRNGHDPPPG